MTDVEALEHPEFDLVLISSTLPQTLPAVSTLFTLVLEIRGAINRPSGVFEVRMEGSLLGILTQPNLIDTTTSVTLFVSIPDTTTRNNLIRNARDGSLSLQVYLGSGNAREYSNTIQVPVNVSGGDDEVTSTRTSTLGGQVSGDFPGGLLVTTYTAPGRTRTRLTLVQAPSPVSQNRGSYGTGALTEISLTTTRRAVMVPAILREILMEPGDVLTISNSPTNVPVSTTNQQTLRHTVTITHTRGRDVIQTLPYFDVVFVFRLGNLGALQRIAGSGGPITFVRDIWRFDTLSS